MADDGSDGGSAHTRNDRDGIIQAAMRRCDKFEEDIDKINDDYKEYKKHVIKDQLGWTLKAWGVLRYLYKSEQEKRDAVMDAIREGFQALNIGEQGSFLDGFRDETESATPTAPDVTSTSEAIVVSVVATRSQGREAALAGVSATDNPWYVGTKAHEAWHEGWMLGQGALAQDLAAPPEMTAGHVTAPRRRDRPPGARDARPRLRQTPADRRAAAEKLFN